MSAPVQDPILQFFAFEHLPANLQMVSRSFCYMAHDMVQHLPRNAERTVALRKLLEAKDAAVRALIAKPSSWAEVIDDIRHDGLDDGTVLKVGQ